MTTARRLIALLSVLFLVPLMAVTLQSSNASAADDGLFTPLAGYRPTDATAVRPVRPNRPATCMSPLVVTSNPT